MSAAAIVAPTLGKIRQAAQVIAPYIVRTPLLRLNAYDGPGEIYLKLECLQPIGVFKVRSMGYAMLSVSKQALGRGVYTASSGNAGVGLAWMAQKLGVAATIYAPTGSPTAKLDAARKLGARVQMLAFDEWWRIIENAAHASDPGLYIDAVRSPAALAGNATIGLEILEDLPDVDAIVVPFGGGGVACGVGTLIRAQKPDTRLIVGESAASTPVTAAFAAGKPVTVEMSPSFITGAGAPSVLAEMWPLVRSLVDGTVVATVSAVEDAVRHLFVNNRIVAEGAGAISVAGALSNDLGGGKIVCVVTGGNIDCAVMAKILQQ